MLVKLVHGKDEINLDGDDYRLDQRFAPPATLINRFFGRTSFGSRKIEEEPANRGWSVSLHLVGTTVSARQRAFTRLASFLSRAGDEETPLYFVYRLYGEYTYEPLWGDFGSFERLEIVAGDVLPGDEFNLISTGKTVPRVTMQLTIKPYNQHQRQRVFEATGGCVEYGLGTNTGTMQGTLILPASYNDFTNPIFGYPGAFDNGWTVSSGLALENVNREYVLFGTHSAHLVNNNAGALLFYQRFTPTGGDDDDMVISCYLKRTDYGVIADNEFRFYRDGLIATNPILVGIGDGWYFAYSQTVGKATDGDYGLYISGRGYEYYVDGFNLEAGTMPTFLTHGDQPGSAWTGTNHASKSTRVEGSLTSSAENIISSVYGTVRIVLKPLHVSSVLETREYYLYLAGKHICYYDKANSRWTFTDGATAMVANDTFAALETVVLHITWEGRGTGQMYFYLNGVLADGDTYIVDTGIEDGDLFLGSDSSTPPGKQFPCIWHDFAIFPRPMTAEEVAADYQQVSILAEQNERVSSLPYFWTRTTDKYLYNDNDATHDPFGILAGLRGETFLTEFRAGINETWSSQKQVTLGHLAVTPDLYTDWLINNPTSSASILFRDLNTTGAAGYVGGGYTTYSVGSSPTMIVGTITINPTAYKVLRGQRIYALLSIVDSYTSAVTIQAAMQLYYGLGEAAVTGEFVTLDTTSAGKNYFMIGPLEPPPVAPIADMQMDMRLAIVVKRTSTTNNLHVDYVFFMPNVLRIGPNTTSNLDGFFLFEKEAELGNEIESVKWGYGPLQVLGQPIRLEPDKLNLIMSHIGQNGQALNISYRLEMLQIYITPRFTIL